MVSSALRRNVVFVAGSVVAGLVIALLVNQLWGEDRNTQNTAAPTSSEAPAPATAADPALVAPTVVATQAVETSGNDETSEPAPVTGAMLGAEDSSAPAVRISAPAVVSIYSQRKVSRETDQLVMTPNGVQRLREVGVQRNLGSGVIVDAQGHIVTNDHVIKGAEQINVQLADGRSAEATVVGTDPDTDLAVLKIGLQPLPVMALGRSDRLAVGDTVLAIGNPLGLSQTVTRGIVSAMGRAELGVATFENFIQTDAAINFGNSGGALVNSRGQLVGINTAVLGKEQGADSLGVAIPVDLVRGVMNEILKNGRVVRGWVGIEPNEISAVDAQQARLPFSGVLMGVYTNSPAHQAGLLNYDKIETVDGQPVRTRQETLARIASRKPGTSVKITGFRARSKEPFSVDLTVVEQPRAVQRQ
jgi:S1-C subfamily serine protease